MNKHGKIIDPDGTKRNSIGRTYHMSVRREKQLQEVATRTPNKYRDRSKYNADGTKK